MQSGFLQERSSKSYNFGGIESLSFLLTDELLISLSVHQGARAANFLICNLSNTKSGRKIIPLFSPVDEFDIRSPHLLYSQSIDTIFVICFLINAISVHL